MVKVPLEMTVLYTSSDTSEILLLRKTCRNRYLIVPRVERKLGPTLPRMSAQPFGIG